MAQASWGNKDQDAPSVDSWGTPIDFGTPADSWGTPVEPEVPKIPVFSTLEEAQAWANSQPDFAECIVSNKYYEARYKVFNGELVTEYPADPISSRAGYLVPLGYPPLLLYENGSDWFEKKANYEAEGGVIEKNDPNEVVEPCEDCGKESDGE